MRTKQLSTGFLSIGLGLEVTVTVDHERKALGTRYTGRLLSDAKGATICARSEAGERSGLLSFETIG
jgi:hypothetical protein